MFKRFHRTGRGDPRPATITPSLGLEVVAFVEVGEEPGVDRLPAEPRAGQRAAGRGVHGREQREQAEMALCFLGLQGGDRQAQVPADDLGDVAERDALVADRVQPGARGCRLQGQPEQVAVEDKLEVIAAGQAVAIIPAGVRAASPRPDLTTVPCATSSRATSCWPRAPTTAAAW
jgi:hypothetical protein